MSKVSYTPYHNLKLKEVDYHGQKVHPLYIRLTFERQNEKFKSAFFHLLAKPKHLVYAGSVTKAPTIDQIIKQEREVIDFIIDKLGQSFSLLQFRREYTFYTTDLCDVTEHVFNDFLRIYFSDEGMPALARSLFEGNKSEVIFQVVDDVKICMKPESYVKLMDASYYTAPPYLVLYSFTRHLKKWPVILSVMEWNNKQIQNSFTAHLKAYFPQLDPDIILIQVNRFIEVLSKKP